MSRIPIARTAPLFALTCCLTSCAALQPASPAPGGDAQLKTRFLTFCDLAVSELNKDITPFGDRENADPDTHHMPFFEDAHATRALCVAFDMTKEPRYLDACRLWADRMIAFQEKMIPAGAYYMNHGRAPGQNEGRWNAADSSSIGMGVLATAVRCTDPADHRKYLDSTRAFARLVIDNYVSPQGGICNGLWPVYAGPWWCSSATFGLLAFSLYEETGDPQYLRVATGALHWLLDQDFRQLSPITFEQRPSGTLFYCFEFYAAGLKVLDAGSPRHQSLTRQLDAALVWMADHQITRGAKVPDYTEKNVDMAGLPYLMLFFARALPQHRDQIAHADRELAYIGDLLLASGRPNISRLMTWEVMTWGMLSYAERLAPGALLRTSGRHRLSRTA